MAMFPKIQRMCPVKDAIASNMDGDICRLCDRKVHNLDAMNDVQRVKFLDACSEEVCVTYSLPQKRKVAAAAAISAALITAPAAAEEFGPSHSPSGDNQEGFLIMEEIIIMTGAIKDHSNVEYLDSAEDLQIPELPVTYESDEG